MDNRKFVYAFKNVHGAISVVNYDVDNTELNSFLSKLDVWRSKGEKKDSIDHKHKEVWFEFFIDLWDALQTRSFKVAMERMGVKLVFEYPFEIKLNRG